jgi:hypothetical protein
MVSRIYKGGANVRRMSPPAALGSSPRLGSFRPATCLCWPGGAALALALACGSADPAAAPAPAPDNATPNERSSLGYNLDFPGDWTNLPPFIDQMQNSRAPVGVCSDEASRCDPVAHLDLDAAGWPRSLRYKDDPSLAYSSIAFLINSSDERSDIGERFIVSWDGDAKITVDNGADQQTGPEPRRLSFTLRGNNTVVRMTAIDADQSGDYPRRVRVFRADFEPLLDSGEEFNPDMLQFLAPFRSIRFMDWMQANAWGQCSGGVRAGDDCYSVISPECGSGGRCVVAGRWSERPTADAPSRLASSQYLDVGKPALGNKAGGYALETLVSLANRVPADPHFNIPADFDDDYVRRFGTYVRDHLAVGLTATIEYSNEVWNFQFPQAQYANAIGREMWPGEGSAWVQYMAGRTHNLCGIMKEVFAGQEERLRCVISPQTGWRDLAKTVLDCPNWVADHPGEGRCDEHLDAINVTGYFGNCLVNQEDTLLGWLDQGHDRALDLAFQQLDAGGSMDACTGADEDNLDHTIDNYGFYGDLARSRGLGLYVYESGTHFSYPDDGGDAVRQLLVDMTRDERMYELYRKNFAGFKAAEGSVMNVWGWVAPDDMWANADSLLDRAHPKYRAIRDFVRDSP